MEFELQAAVFNYLSADASVTDLVGGIYDHVPQNDKGEPDVDFPYVTVGDDLITNSDADTHFGIDATLTIHVWARSEGRKQCKLIQGAVRESLKRAQLIVPGWRVDTTNFLQSQTFTDSDGQTRHGVQTIRVTAWQSAA